MSFLDKRPHTRGAPCARGPDRPCSGTGASDVLCTGAEDSAMRRIEVISGPERRRRWSGEQKRAIVAEAFAPGSSVSAVARRVDVIPGQIYRWRRELAGAAVGFAEVVVSPASYAAADAGAPAIEIELASHIRIRIPTTTPGDLACAFVKAVVTPDDRATDRRPGVDRWRPYRYEARNERARASGAGDASP